MTRPSKPARVLPVALAVVVTAAAVVAAVVLPGAASGPRVADAEAGTSGRDRGYITIGSLDGEQFSDGELRDIAENHRVVVFAKFHGGWDVELHHEATRRLKALNPGLRVFAYMSTKFWFDKNRWGVEIDPDWFLVDSDGELVPKIDEGTEQDRARYIDLADPDYRAWALGVARSWMEAAPYDGVRFDAADPIGDFGERDVRRWEQLLDEDELGAYNAGIAELLSDARDVVPSVLFNGISPSPIRGPDRALSMLEYTDGAMNEDFCVNNDGELRDIVADIEIMEELRDRELYLRASIDPDAFDPAELARLRRVCVGSFLMGWQPGSTFLNVGSDYGVSQLSERPGLLSIDLGAPTEDHGEDGEVLRRAFANGVVVVNLGDEPAEVDVPPGLVRVPDASEDGSESPADTIAGEDAAFFLAPD